MPHATKCQSCECHVTSDKTKVLCCCCDKASECSSKSCSVLMKGSSHMTAHVGKAAPDFKASCVMPDGSFKEISLSDYKGKYVVLFFYPLDFTYVCPSEIIAFNKAQSDFHKKGVQLLACSVDSQFTHLAWTKTPTQQGGIGGVSYPLISDLTKSISHKYGVLIEDQGIALRGLFLIDKEGIIRHCVINDLPLGRSVEECLRVVDALQHVETHGEVCPASWKKGDVAMKPTAEGCATYLKSMK